VWYEIRTAVNNTEPLFWSEPNRDLFKQGLYEVRQIYGFELSGLRFEGSTVSFYIKPSDGFELPKIMQWVKQTYAVRYNVRSGRIGHIWGPVLVGDSARGTGGVCVPADGLHGGRREKARDGPWRRRTETRRPGGQSGTGHGGQTLDGAEVG
jgi:hypothetical protein